MPEQKQAQKQITFTLDGQQVTTQAGTLVIEAALIAGDIAPGLGRDYWGFERWLKHDAKTWETLRQEAERRKSAGIRKLPMLLGFDQDRHIRLGYMPPIQRPSITRHLGWLEKSMRTVSPVLGAINLMVYSKNIAPLTPVRHRWVTRKILPGKIARPSVGRSMKYDR